MAYLLDASLFVIVLIGLILLDLCFWSEHRSRSENLLVPAGLFVGGYALLVWLTGLLWKLVPGLWIVLPWPILLSLLVSRRASVMVGVRSLKGSFVGLQGEDYALLGYLALAGALSFALTLVPPSGAEYDALTYHLGAPAQYLRHGRIIELQYDHHSYFPFTVEMWFLLGLAAKGPVLAKLFHWMMLPAGALSLLSMGSRHGSRRTGLWAAVLYVSIPLVLIESTTAYIDLGFTAFTLLAVMSYMRATEEDSVSWSAAAGAFCGFCMGSKYFGGLVFFFLGLWLLSRIFIRKDLRVTNLAAFAVPALLLGMPWYFRNWLWTGDPVFPFGYSVFHSPKWTAEMARAYYADQANFGFGKAPLDLLWLPWRLAMSPLNAAMPFWPLNSRIPPPQGKYGFFEVPGLVLTACPGPIWLALGVPALFVPRKSRAVWFALSILLFLTAFWIASTHQVRYYLPGLALFCFAAAYTLRFADQSLTFAPKVIRGGLVLWLAFSVLFFVRQGGSAWGVVTGRVAPATYLSGFGAYLPMTWASQATPPTAKFAVYGEPRCFYLDRDYFWANREHSTLIDYAKIKSPEDLVKALRGQGATHVLLALPGAVGIFGSPPPYWQEALDRGLVVPLTELNHYGIYEIR